MERKTLVHTIIIIMVNPSKPKKSAMDQTCSPRIESNQPKFQSLPMYYQGPKPYEPNIHQIPKKSPNRSDVENKDSSKRRFFGNFFRRKKENSSEDSTSDKDVPKKPLKPLNNHNVPSYHQNKIFDIQSPLVSPRMTRMISNEHLNRTNLYRHNLIGIPHKPLGSSVSYDSLPVSGMSWNSESAYGSISSLRSNSGFDGRSPSAEAISRKERREIMMAKVRKMRDTKDSSSEEDQSVCGSEASFSSGSLNRRSKSSRTERYLRRKSREFENLKRESDKDKRNKEAVQSRILEIQRARKNLSSQAQNNPLAEKPRWSAQLVYQESNENFDPVIVPTPFPYPTSPTKAIPNNRHIPRTYSQTDVDKFRAINTVGIGPSPIPPVPPPRDASRYINPLHRPISYSFENINQHIPKPYKKHHMSLSPCSSIARPNHSTFNHRRATSEQRLAVPLSPKDIKVFSPFTSSYVENPVPIKAILTIKPMYSSQPYSIQSSVKPEEKASIASMPPSPSSDYSSYISENSSAQRFSPQSFSKPVIPAAEPKISESTNIKSISQSIGNSKIDNSYKNLSSPASIPQRTFSNSVPAPPVRDSSSVSKTSKEVIKQRFIQAIEETKNSTVVKEKLHEAYNKEKDRILKTKSKNFEQALNELEDLYKQLNLQSEDIIDGAERRDLPTEHQLLWHDNKKKEEGSQEISENNLIKERSRSQTPKLRRSFTPDKVTDDYHYRRCNKLPKKVKNHSLPTGSYMLVSPVHGTAKNYYEDGVKPVNEPDIISDDLTFKNAQRANSIKVIDPQPPFGIPLGPTTQGSSSDYLHIEAKENYKPLLTSRKLPDAAMDDLAFRTLRKETSLTEKSVNLSELDSILSESSLSKKRIRSHSVGPLPKSNSKSVPFSPRRLKQIKKSKSKFYDSYRGAITDTENVLSAEDLIDNISLKSAKDCDDTSTETLTEQSVQQHNEQVRDAIIREATSPPGGPVKLIPGNPANIERIPSDPSTRLGHTYSPVNIEKLTDLISTIKSDKSSSDVSESLKSRPKSELYPHQDANRGNDRRHSSVDFSSFCSSVVSNVVLPVYSHAEKIFMPSTATGNVGDRQPENMDCESLMCQGNTKQEAESLAKSLQCKDGIISATKAKELEKRNRRLEYEKQRVAGLKKSKPVEKTNAKPDLKKPQEKKIASGTMVQTRSPSKGSITTTSSEDAERRERIQRYKEERRKQMAARYGTAATLSSSEEEEVTGSSSSTRKRRRNKATDSSSTDADKKKQSEKDKKKVETVIKEDKKIVSQKSFNNNSNNVNESDDSVYQVRKREHATAQKNATNDAKMRRKGSGTEKDKSHKRKSNLNRAPFEEPVPPLDDAARRRRRKSDNILSNFGNSELTSVQLVANVSSSSSSGPGTSHPVPAPRKQSPHKKPEIPDTLKKDSTKSKEGKKSSVGEAVSGAISATASVASLVSGTSLVSHTPTSSESLRSDEVSVRLRNNGDADSGDESQQHINNLTAQARSLIAHVDSISNIRKVDDMEVTTERSRNSSYVRNGESDSFLKGDEEYNNSFQKMRDKSPFWRDNARGRDEKPKNYFLRKEKEAQNSSYKREGRAKSPIFVKKDRPKTPPFLKKEEKLKSPPFVRKLDSSKDCETNSTVKRNTLANTNDEDLLETSLRIDEDGNQNYSPVKKEERPFSPMLRDDRPTSPLSKKESSFLKKDEGPSRNISSRVESLSKRLAFHEAQNTDEVKKIRDRAPSLETDSPRRSPDHYSILKRKSSDYGRSHSPEPQSILKKAASTDMDVEPRPILKKSMEPVHKKSIEDISSKPRPILKKKSLTDDELESDLPKSILKGKSGEDISTDGIVSPTPILKIPKPEVEFKAPKSDSDLKPILKRRQTTDAVKMNLDSDSDSEPVARMRSDSAPESAIRNQKAAPKPILKHRSDEGGGRKERPLSVAERIAGMEAMQEQSKAKPKRDSSIERVKLKTEELAAEAEQVASSVSQRAAFFSQLEKANDKEESTRKTRGARFATQPVTDSEVNKARRDSPVDLKERYGSLDSVNQSCSSEKFKDVPKSILKTTKATDDQPRGILKNESPLSSLLASPEHGPLKSVLKKDSSIEDSKEIKSILKRQSESLDHDSSDSSTETDPKARRPIKMAEDLAEALRSIEPIKDGDSRVTENVKSSETNKARRPKSNVSSPPSESRFMEAKVTCTSYTNEGRVVESRANSLAVVESRKSESKVADSGVSSLAVIESRKSKFEKSSTEFERTAFDEEALIFGTGSGFMDGFILRRPTDLSETKNDSLFDSSSDSDDLLDRVSSPLPERLSHEGVIERSEMDASDILSKSSIFSNRRLEIDSQRLDGLQDKEKGWQKKIKELDKDVGLGQKKERPNSLLERVSQLENSSQQWKCRVSQSDASTFTATHRMVTSVPGAVPMPGLRSPSLPKKTPAPKVFKSKTGGNLPEILGTAKRELFSRSISQTDGQEETVVAVPQLDDESFNAFFTSSAGGADVDIDISHFDQVTRNSSDLLVTRRNIRVTRRQQTKGNPLRNLAKRENIKSEYTEIKLGVGDRELRRMKVEEISRSSSFAMEALAGLASKENFSAVALKKTDNPVARDMPPFTSLMLIRVKGRRHPQVKLVSPEVCSVSSNDDYILVTPSEVFHYKGEFSNVIERAVAADIAQYLIQTKDMGVSADCKVTDVSSESKNSVRARFWKLLGGNESSSPSGAGLPDDDDVYESALIASNKIYEVNGSSLVPVDHAWGQNPKHELLNSDKVLVFDFGSEAYLWAGKFAGAESRRMGSTLLKELWTDPYDYSDCDINPVDMTLNPKSRCTGKRPTWGICGKITENVETILFKEKFIDWPDMAQRSRLQEVEKENAIKHDPVSELDACDVNKMLDEQPPPPDLVLEMSHLGRGTEYYDAEVR